MAKQVSNNPETAVAEARSDARALLDRVNTQIVATRRMRNATINALNGNSNADTTAGGAEDAISTPTSQSVGDILSQTTVPAWALLSDDDKRVMMRDVAFMLRSVRDALAEMNKQDVAERALLAKAARDIRQRGA